MSLPTFTEARDEILGLLKTAWDAGTPALNSGQVVRMEWPGVVQPTAPPADAPYARPAIRHGRGAQRTLGTVGNRRFTRIGLVTVQVFAPISRGGGLSLAESLGIIARDAFEGVGTASGIWFRNVRIQEIGADDIWQQFNVIAEFEYDEIK